MKVLVAGSFGFGNVGDEAVTLALQDLASKTGYELQFVPLSRFGAVDLPDVIGLDDAMSNLSTWSDCPVLFAGGGIVEPHARSVLSRCTPLIRTAGINRSSCLGISVEPQLAYSWRARRAIKRDFGDISGPLYVRDAVSAQTLRRILPNRDVLISGDSVLAMKPSNSLPGEVMIDRSFMAVSLAPRWQNESWIEWIAKNLVEIARSQDLSILFVPMAVNRDSDVEIHRKVGQRITLIAPGLEQYHITETTDPKEVLSVMHHANLVVGMRLHSLVMAASMETPFVGIAYHPKVAAFAQTVGLRENVVPLVLPSKQTQSTRGYSFEDLSLLETSLVNVASKARCTDFRFVREWKSQLEFSFRQVGDFLCGERCEKLI